MNSVEIAPHPAVLNRTVGRRSDDLLTALAHWQMYRALSNKREGLGEYVDLSAPWGVEDGHDRYTGYIGLMDGVVGSGNLKLSLGHPDCVDGEVYFEKPDDCERWIDFIPWALGGMHGVRMPKIYRHSENQLTAEIRRFSYPALVAAGQIGSAALRAQYKKALGRNLVLVSRRTVGEIEAFEEQWPFLPEDLRARLAWVRKRYGKAATSMTFTNSGLSLLGAPMRDLLDHPLRLMETAGYRAAWQKGVLLQSKEEVKKGQPLSDRPPMSGASLGTIAVGEASSRIREARTVDGVIDIAGGGLGVKGTVSAIKLAIAATVATTIAVGTRIRDREIVRMQSEEADRGLVSEGSRPPVPRTDLRFHHQLT